MTETTAAATATRTRTRTTTTTTTTTTTKTTKMATWKENLNCSNHTMSKLQNLTKFSFRNSIFKFIFCMTKTSLILRCMQQEKYIRRQKLWIIMYWLWNFEIGKISAGKCAINYRPGKNFADNLKDGKIRSIQVNTALPKIDQVSRETEWCERESENQQKGERWGGQERERERERGGGGGGERERERDRGGGERRGGPEDIWSASVKATPWEWWAL